MSCEETKRDLLPYKDVGCDRCGRPLFMVYDFNVSIWLRYNYKEGREIHHAFVCQECRDYLKEEVKKLFKFQENHSKACNRGIG